MNRQQFNSRNDIAQVLTFQKSGATTSFDPTILYSSGSRRVSWRLNNGSEIKQIAGNTIVYTGFTSDTSIRNIEMRSNSFKNLVFFDLQSDNLYGNLDLSVIPNIRGQLFVFNNSNLTGITHSQSSGIFTNYWINNCNLIGNLDLTPLSGLGGQILLSTNPNLTGVTHTSSSQNITTYWINNCNLIGNLDLTPLSGLGGNFQTQLNPQLTGITHTTSNNNFTIYNAFASNLTGTHDLSMLKKLGGNINLQNNPNLKQVIHTTSPNNITFYSLESCDITGNLIVPFSGLGGTFRVQSNPSLTGITHSSSSQNFTTYYANLCDLTGNLDLTPLSGLGGEFRVDDNSSLTGITHGPSNNNFTLYLITGCDITGTLNLSNLYKFGGASTGSTCSFRGFFNTNLTNIVFPTLTGTTFFRNTNNSDFGGAISFYTCNLDYTDFKPLALAKFLTGSTQGNPRISIQNNNMIAADVNHILVDFSGNTTTNPSGWSNINLNIGGSNANPDSSSGGYDGLAAISFLTGSPYNWTITY